MHASALQSASEFYDKYPLEAASVVEIGSQIVNGSIKDVCPKHYSYIGLDYSPANGVDIVLEDEYKFPLPNGSTDIVVNWTTPTMPESGDVGVRFLINIFLQ